MGFDRTILGRTGIEVGRLGVSASYGVPAAAVEEAFDRGVNYLYWGSIRREPFAEALRHLSRQRQHMVLVVQSYSRAAALVGWSVERALRRVAYEYADVLLLGMWNRPVPPRILDAARRLRERGLVRHLAVSTHNRRAVRTLASLDIDIVHVRYSAAHRGAESEVFPHLPAGAPGIVSFTATRWKNLMDPRRVPRGERVPTAADCYRFVLSNPAVDVCMTGPATAAEMREALLAWEQGPLPAEELAWMRRVGDAVH
jgi:aryl-alcohol dehydrogenase-like predicted oxidoreductase